MTTLVATATWSTRPKPVGRPDRCDHATYGANGHNANGLRRGEGCGDCDLDIWFAAEARRCRNTDVSFEDLPRVPDVGATQHWSPARERSSPRSRGGTNRSHNGCRVSAMTFAKHPSCSSAPGCRRTRDLRRQGNEWGSSGVGSLPCERTTVAPSHPGARPGRLFAQRVSLGFSRHPSLLQKKQGTVGVPSSAPVTGPIPTIRPHFRNGGFNRTKECPTSTASHLRRVVSL